MEEKLLLEMIVYYAGDPRRIQHFLKVYSFARIIGKQEDMKSDEFSVLCAAAIVHDIGIKKAEEIHGYNNGKLQEQYGPELAREMLSKIGYKEKEVERICYLVGHHHTYNEVDGLDYQILIESDLLVNAYEDNSSQSAIQNMSSRIMKTQTGKKIMEDMYEDWNNV